MLTDVSVRKAAPTTKRQEIADGQTPGLYLIVQPSGSKSWAVRYSRGGKVMKVTLGGYPALPLVEARRRALGIAASVANGADPAADKKAEKATTAPPPARTVKAIAAEFLKRHTDEKNGVRWAAETKRILDRNILPAIGDKSVASVGKAEFTTCSTRSWTTAGRSPQTARSRSSRSSFAGRSGAATSTAIRALAYPSPATKRSVIASCPTTSLRASGAQRRAWPIRSGRPSDC